jgi:predicted N-acyltransferase
MEVTAEFLPSLGDLARDDWNRITGLDYPFLRHEFLYGLEKTACTTAETGWQPCHLVLHESMYSTGPGQMRGDAAAWITIPSW